MSNNWSAFTTPEIVARRAGGRRRYNALRRDLAWIRRYKVSELMIKGVKQSDMARQLGVSPATISRDVWANYRLMCKGGTCLVCGANISSGMTPRLAKVALDMANELRPGGD